MTNNYPRHSRAERSVAYALTLPFLAVVKGGVLAKQFIAGQNKPVAQAPAQKAPVVAKAPPVPTPSPVVKSAPVKFVAADRVHSQVINSEKVSFYHYAREGVIKAVVRRDGVAKETMFLPVDAHTMSLPFNIEGAVKWVRQHGFNKPPSNNAKVVKAVSHVETPNPLPVIDNPMTQRASAPMPLAKPAEVPQLRSHRRVFEGEIVSFGSTTRKSKEKVPGKKPRNYTTYQMTLEVPSIGTREFIGEHLEELVAAMELRIGQDIRLEQLGRREFTVDLPEGKTETRHRNEYAITVL